MNLLGAPEDLLESLRHNYILSRDMQCDLINDGIVPPLKRIAQSNQSSAPYYAGGVYERNGVVSETSLLDRSWGRIVDAFQKHEITAFTPTHTNGAAVYGGLIIKHFGHFILESTSRLWWPLLHEFNGPILFHSDTKNPLEVPHIREFFELLGIAERVLIIETCLSFDTIYVPEAAFKIQLYAHPIFLTPFKLITSKLGLTKQPTATKKIYLSRTQLGAGLAIGEDAIEHVMVNNGYELVYPERLSLLEQIRCVNSAETISGVVGSALHLLLFTSNRHTFCVNRINWLNLNYVIIDQLTQTKSCYIWGNKSQIKNSSSNPKYPCMLDIVSIFNSLQSQGFATSFPSDYSESKLECQYLSAWHMAHYSLTRNAANMSERLSSIYLAKLLNPKSNAVDWYLQREMTSQGLRLEWDAMQQCPVKFAN